MIDVPLLRLAKRGAELAPNTMNGPRSEWAPILLYQAGDGVCHTVAVTDMDTRELIWVASERMRELLLADGAVQAAFVMPSWVTTMSPEGTTREEMVTIMHVTRKRARAEAALVLRTEMDKPRLGPWGKASPDLWEPPSDAAVFAGALRKAIQR